jgi:hypothetical protein
MLLYEEKGKNLTVKTVRSCLYAKRLGSSIFSKKKLRRRGNRMFLDFCRTFVLAHPYSWLGYFVYLSSGAKAIQLW